MVEAIQKIRAAGLVGMGGAGFPTHVKLDAPIEHLIVNGLECEPLLGTDRYVMRNLSDKLVEALSRLKSECNVDKATFCLKKSYVKEIAALKAAIDKAGAPIDIHTTESFYPAGDEQVVVYEVTGRTVPPMNIPLAVGCAVMNVGTLLAAYDGFCDKPLTHRYVTVTGAVNKPTVVYAPIGASFAACIAAAGGVNRENCCIVSGGPMMGKRFPIEEMDNLFVSKTTSGILILPLDKYRGASVNMEQIRSRAKAACIQCNYCTQLCPRHLLGHPLEPHRIMRKLAYEKVENLMEDPVIQSASLCSECGVCEVYACPMGLQPRSVNALLKQELGKAGYRYPKGEASTTPHPMRSSRLAPTKRMAARAGVYAYYGAPLDVCVPVEPDCVTLSLRQGLGAPSQPQVSVGQRVEQGERIACCQEGKLGADLHASICGVVEEISDGIRIRREESK